jgi:hypothetical protein
MRVAMGAWWVESELLPVVVTAAFLPLPCPLFTAGASPLPRKLESGAGVGLPALLTMLLVCAP